MKFNFRKIASAVASTALVGSTIALAAAASFPAPFVQNGVADVGIVYGSAGAQDLVSAAEISANLGSTLVSQGGGSGGNLEGGDSVLLAKSSDNLNIRDALNGPFGSTVDDDDLEVLLADGEYTADDHDDFSYEQKITLGAPVLSHFRDSDYESQEGLSSRTPVVGINISSGDFVMNYTLDFLDQAESDVTSGDFEDFEGSDLPLLGKTFYVSDAKNGSSTSVAGKFTLLDSANSATVKEGEVINLDVDGTNYEVKIDFIDSNSAVLIVNGQASDDLAEGATQKLSGGSYLGIRDVRKLEVSGELGSVEFSIGSGKLEITSGSDVKINDESISDLKAWVYKGTSNGGDSLDKIEIQWVADDDLFITPASEITLPGFGGIKFSMTELVRPTEEKITVENDGDDSIQIKAPIKDGEANINLLYAGTDGLFDGLGKSSTERLATAQASDGSIIFKDKQNGNDFHKWVVVSYNSSDDAQSYVLSFDTNEDTSAGRNETTIKNEITGQSWSDRTTGTFTLGDVQITINSIVHNATDRWVNFSYSVSGGMSVDKLYTVGGLKIQLPIDLSATTSNTTVDGGIEIDGDSIVLGHNSSSWYLFMHGEDKDDNLFSGTKFSMTADANSDNELEINALNTTGGGAGSGTGGENGLEMGDTNTYEAYVLDDVAPRTLHYTNGDQDYVEVYYPSGDSETYAKVYIADVSAGRTGSSELGDVMVMDTEVSKVSGKNLIVVGGSCVNTVAASLLGSTSPVCGTAFTASTGVGAGEFLIQTWNSPFATGKIATLVAGYEVGDTRNAVNYLTSEAPMTDSGKKYKGTSATEASLVTA